MNMKLKHKVETIKNNILYKTIFVSIFSTIVTLAFVIYNAYLGIRFGDAFASGIAIYYLLLAGIKLSAIIIERKILYKAPEEIAKIRLKNYKIFSCFVFLIDLCLIAPIIIMALYPKDVPFGIIPAITIAVYSVYNIVFAIINYKKSKDSQNPTVILIRTINVIGAIVSILTLQHTLIMVNGGMNDGMRTLSLISSTAFIVLIVVFSILSFVRNRKLLSNKF